MKCFLKPLAIGTFTYIVPIAVLLTPALAQAGLFSAVLNTIIPNSVAASDIADNVSGSNSSMTNSQTVAILSAPLTIDPRQKTPSDPVLVYDNAVSSDVGPSGTSADVDGETGESSEISTYIVKPGDTLSGVAKMFDVSVNTIMWANNVEKNSALQIGSTLIILPISGVKHTVVAGDTIESIAKKYNGDIQDIMSYNGLTAGQKLNAGDEIIIPDGEVAAVATAVKSKSVHTTSPGAIEPLLDTYPNGPSNIGYFIRPVNGPKTQGLHGHNAIDFGNPIGTPVHAAADGKVIIAKMGGWNGGYGNYIVISHPNGEQTLYAHLSAESVNVGAQVSQNDVIGKVGTTGESTGPHLHFEVRGGKNPFGP